jgi:hypothetical protein
MRQPYLSRFAGTATAEGRMLLLGEADALFGGRTGVKDSYHR